MKSRKLIGAQFLKIKTLYLWALSCIQPSWIVSVNFEVMNYKKYTVFFGMEFFLENMWESVSNVLYRSPSQNIKHIKYSSI